MSKTYQPGDRVKFKDRHLFEVGSRLADVDGDIWTLTEEGWFWFAGAGDGLKMEKYKPFTFVNGSLKPEVQKEEAEEAFPSLEYVHVDAIRTVLRAGGVGNVSDVVSMLRAYEVLRRAGG